MKMFENEKATVVNLDFTEKYLSKMAELGFRKDMTDDEKEAFEKEYVETYIIDDLVSGKIIMLYNHYNLDEEIIPVLEYFKKRKISVVKYFSQNNRPLVQVEEQCKKKMIMFGYHLDSESNSFYVDKVY